MMVPIQRLKEKRRHNVGQPGQGRGAVNGRFEVACYSIFSGVARRVLEASRTLSTKSSVWPIHADHFDVARTLTAIGNEVSHRLGLDSSPRPLPSFMPASWNEWERMTFCDRDCLDRNCGDFSQHADPSLGSLGFDPSCQSVVGDFATSASFDTSCPCLCIGSMP